jgi:hypothetical protein
MKTAMPWYWEIEGGHHDHDACGLMTCVGDNGRIHYARAGELVVTTACHRQPKNLWLLAGPRIVECRVCCAVARTNRDRIAQRVVSPIISGESRTNFIRRKQVRKQHG